MKSSKFVIKKQDDVIINFSYKLSISFHHMNDRKYHSTHLCVLIKAFVLCDFYLQREWSVWRLEHLASPSVLRISHVDVHEARHLIKTRLSHGVQKSLGSNQ